MTITESRPTEDWQLVNDLAADRSPARDLHRRAVLLAVIACASEHDGEVHASWVRPLTPEWVGDKIRGAITSSLASKGILVETGETMRSGDKRNRNSRRHLSVYKVASWERLNAEVQS